MNTFSSLSLASIRARREDRPARFVALAACFTIVSLAGTAAAATLTVTNLNDNGSGSLRNAIASANAGDTIQFQITGTITLTSGVLNVGQNLTIAGPGPSQLAISGNHTTPVLVIGATVSLSGLTIENGIPAVTGGAAGIMNNGTLTVTNCTITGNAATIFGISGGGIANYGTLMLESSTVSNNSASTGGGIFNVGTMTISNSTVSGNSGLYGGGIDGENANSSLTITNSTLFGNSAIYNGGGIYIIDGSFAIVSSTVAGNSAGSGGGGIFNETDPVGTRTTIARTLLANNAGSNCQSAFPISSQGYNLSDDNSCAAAFIGTGDQNNVVPGAGLDTKGLQSNGGPTQTIALLPASPAVDAVPVASCTGPNGNPLTADQRGTTRPQGKACDTGAYELVQTVPFSAFHANAVITTGRNPGFALTSWFTPASGSPALQLQTQTLTLQIANYTLTLPPASLKPLWNAPNAPLGYEGTINGAHLVIGLIPLANNTWSFDAAGTPVTISATNPVPVTLTIGQNMGTASVQAIIR